MNLSKKLLSVAVAASLMTSVVANDMPQTADAMYKDAQAMLATKLARKANTKKAKNVILMIADGNGVPSNYMTRLYMGQQAGGFGDEFIMPKEEFPYLAISKTYNTNAQTPDSAGTATAMNSGVKVKAGVLGVSDKVNRGDCSLVKGNELSSFADIMTAQEKSVGIVSTARITHATPAAVYSHSADRGWAAAVPEGCDQKTIAEQLVDEMEKGGVDIALGGGLRNFVPKAEGTKGKRKDGRDLTKEAQEKGISFVKDAAGLKSAKLDGKTPLLGLFTMSHMAYEADRSDKEPSLAEMSETAINYLSKNDKGYYLEIEAGRIDHANHDGNAYRTVTDGVAFAEAVKKVVSMVGDDTLVVVTADHAHAVTLNGYTGRGSDVLGLAMKINPNGTKHLDELELASDGKPYTIVSYANGTGSILKKSNNYMGTRAMLTQKEVTDKDYVQEALIPRSSESHSGADVAIYATGPWAHLFDGTVEQNYIFHVMNHAVNNGE